MVHKIKTKVINNDDKIVWNIEKYSSPSAIKAIQTQIKIEPTLKPIPVIRWKIEKIAVKTFLWILRCGDKGLLLFIIYYIYFI